MWKTRTALKIEAERNTIPGSLFRFFYQKNIKLMNAESKLWSRGLSQWFVRWAGTFAMIFQTIGLMCKTQQKDHHQPVSFSAGLSTVPESNVQWVNGLSEFRKWRCWNNLGTRSKIAFAQKKERAHQMQFSPHTLKQLLSFEEVFIWNIYLSVLYISTTIVSAVQEANADFSCIFSPQSHQNNHQGSSLWLRLSLAALSLRLQTCKSMCPLHRLPVTRNP